MLVFNVVSFIKSECGFVILLILNFEPMLVS